MVSEDEVHAAEVEVDFTPVFGVQIKPRKCDFDQRLTKGEGAAVA